MFSLSSSGSFDNIEKFLRNVMDGSTFDSLSKYGAAGVSALASATPRDEGVTANSWTYEVKKDANSWSIIWSNTNVVDGRPIAVLLQYGHGTGTGGYVPPQPYINEALAPIFEQMAAEGWKAVINA